MRGVFAIFPIRSSISLIAFVSFFSLGTGCSSISFVSLLTFLSLGTGCSSISFVSLLTFFSLGTGCSSISFVAFITFFSDDRSALVAARGKTCDQCQRHQRQHHSSLFHKQQFLSSKIDLICYNYPPPNVCRRGKVFSALKVFSLIPIV